MGSAEQPPGTGPRAPERTAGVERPPDLSREERAQDALAQTFAAILVQLHAAEESAAATPDDAVRYRAQAMRLAREGLLQARRAMEALRLRDAIDPPDVTLHGALARLARWANTCCGTSCDFLDGRTATRCSPARDALAYECAHAVVAAVATSPECSRVGMRLGSHCGRLVLTMDVCWTEQAPAWIGTLPTALATRLTRRSATLRVHRGATHGTLAITAEFEE